MLRLSLVPVLILCLFVFDSPAEQSAQGLIPVRPYYQDSQNSVSPDKQLEHERSYQIHPKDQMYIFWVLGKLISYPVDKAESFLSQQKKKLFKEGAPVQATAPPQHNPFSSLNWREIPPAPPVLDEEAKR